RVLAALAYTLSPRVLSTVGGLSSEALPALLVPAILLPLVLATQGRLGPRRAAAFSALAVLGCGGVNATATVLAAVPAALWLATRAQWWRAPVTWWWVAGTVAASAWWLGPLVVLGRYSPPFLGWIERASDVVREIDLLDVARGTTHWLGFVVTSGGEWWPAGYAVATGPLLVVTTALVAGLSLGGLALRGVPERRFLLLTLGLGVVLLGVPHLGPVSSPLAPLAQALLDGPLVALRNIHKADPLVRLPLAIGLAHALDRALAALGRSRPRVRLPVAAAGLLVGVAVVSPGLSGAIAPRGTFTDMARQWREAGTWLSQRPDDGRALVVPAASFGEYDWGRTIDEPIRPLSSIDYAVRDAVPLTPAGTIRVLDAVEQRLQTGRDVGGAVDVLRRLGVRYLVLRNDLDSASAGQPSVTYARSAIRSTAGTDLARGFGLTRLDASGERVFPVEVYDIGTAAPLAVTQPVSDAVGVSGGPEDLLAVADEGVDGLTVLDGDLVDGVDPGRRVVTDGYRARERWFGATRGRDTSSTLAADELVGTRDYRPWDDLSRHAVTAFGGGVSGVAASSSLATTLTLAGLRPADRPAAVLDGDPTTAWVTQFDERPTLTVRLDDVRAVATARVHVLTDEDRFPGLGSPTLLAVRTDGGEVRVDVPGTGVVDVPLPPGATGTVSVEVVDTDGGDPGGVLTGLVALDLDGVAATESVVAPDDGADRSDAVLLSGGLPGSDGCVQPDESVVCFGDGGRDAEGGAVLARRVSTAGGGTFEASGTLEVSRWAADPPGLAVPGLSVEASSSRTASVAARPEATVDGDDRTAWSPAPDDAEPTLTIRLDEPADVGAVTIAARRGWMARYRPFVRVRLDDRELIVRASADGRLAVSGSDVSTVSVAVVPLVGPTRSAPASLEVEEVSLAGADLPRPAERITRPCGEGPVLTVDGASTPTRLDGPRSALWGEGDLRWSACAPVVLASGPHHDVEVRGTPALRPASVSLVTPDAAPVPPPVAADVTAQGPTHLTSTVATGPQRLLALAMNHNVGWEASLEGEALAPVVVDGFRQGFVLPDGVAGQLEVRFAPDGPYRWALGLGLLLTLLVPLGLLVPDRSRRPAAAAGDPDAVPRPVVVAVVATGGALLVAGPWAAVAAGLALGALHLRRDPRDEVTAVVVVGLVTASGALAAVTDPSRPTLPWVEAVVTLAVTAAAVLAGAGPVVRPSAWPGARRRRGSATPGPG
ncbi:MAG TPA: alpha-(1-_3)-arabinofuranosyltransferase family protein, partial [Ornithinibacter sp.]|nr:alpha-(1->3)-arabinofuranosyltransferase family protein [Ornithinibacter sp.]